VEVPGDTPGNRRRELEEQIAEVEAEIEEYA
jgi:hypothetical protein